MSKATASKSLIAENRDCFDHRKLRVMGIILLISSFIWILPSTGFGATCTVNTAQNPDPFITGALSTTTCALGNSGNDSTTDLAAIFGVAVGNVSLIDRDQLTDNNTTNENALFFTPINGTNGNWYVDLNGLNYEKIILVLKDGGTGDLNPQCSSARDHVGLVRA